MTILVLAEVFPPRTGGSGRWLWELYRRLSSVDVHVAAAEAEGAAAFDATAEVTVHRLPLRLSGWGVLRPRSVWQYSRAFLRLRAIAARVRPDAIHCAKCLPEGMLGLAIARQRRVPLVCYAHGEELTLAKTSRELGALTRRVLQRAALVVANSRFTKGLLLEDWRVAPEKVVVMHPGVDTVRFAPAPPAGAVRSRLGWSNRRVILTVGALQKRKGQDMLIRALPRIREACPNVLYSMVGEGWEREYLEALVHEQGVRDLVQFRGVPNDTELVECYQQCDLFALPSRQVGWDVEGFGIVLLEAQACGKPVIAGASGGTVDALQPGSTGELVNCDGPGELAEAVVNLLCDVPRLASMADSAREFAVTRFDWPVLAAQAAAVLAGARPPEDVGPEPDSMKTVPLGRRAPL